ncbi:MAG: polysaccharide export protein [Rhodoferax sp.]|nr:polysaccharide export protein [Rhodoferax sp.]
MQSHLISRTAHLVATTLLAALAGCAGPSALPGPGVDASVINPNFKPIEKPIAANLLSKEDLALLEESVNPVYRIGSGDVVKLNVFGRAEVSGTHVVGPDGTITVPLAGDVLLNDLTREAARDLIHKRLQEYFTSPLTTFGIEQYTSNQVTVLGRVERAGMQKFPHPPTLAEVLASAGAIPLLDKQATLTRCAIMRGRDKLIWVDLKALLNGDSAYNLRMKKGDIVFIPDSSDTSVYVLGSVPKPGSYRLTPRMTVLDVLAQAGGPNEDAAPEQIGIYRAGSNQVEVIPFADLIDVSRKVNYALEDGDVVFIPKSKLASMGYFMRQLAPAISVLTFGLTVDTLAK